MTPLVLLVALVVGKTAAEGVVDLRCSDNATCLDNLTKEFVRSLRQQKTVRLFDYLTIEPLGRTRVARSSQGPVARFLENHAFSFSWNDLSFRLAKPENRNDAVELEIFEGRSAKDVPEVPKKSTSKVEEEEEEKRPKGPIRRRRNKKVLQALIPMVFGMKSAGTVIFAMAVVTALTIKAFLASKLALLVTVGMALKRLYESYGIAGIPATSNVLWTIARYFRILFGLPGVPPLNAANSMNVPMYQVPYPMGMPPLYGPGLGNMPLPTPTA